MHKIEVNYQAPKEINISEFKILGAKGIYYLPVIVAILGVLVMTVITLCLKYIWKFTSSNPWTVDMGGEH